MALRSSPARRGQVAQVFKPSVVSLFSCGMGMDLGFEKAGFGIRYTNDITPFACNTISANRPRVHCDEGDITDIPSGQIARRAGLGPGHLDVIVGGPPCQSFSTAGRRRGLRDKRGAALLEYIRVISDLRPKFFVFENVPGLLSAAKDHVPFYDRRPGMKLRKSQEYGSVFAEITSMLKDLKGYKIEWDKVNAADYGVPQKRIRLVLIGSRTADPALVFDDLRKAAAFSDPKKETGKRPWRTLRDALDGLKDPEKEHVEFPQWGRYLKHVPPGGCWVDLPKRLVRQAMKGAADSDDPRKRGRQGGRRGFYRRLSWDAPAPTLVVSPAQFGSCICHPDEERPLTVREYARVQGFPDSWKFEGSTMQKYRMIGEAVPVELAKAVASAVKKHL